MIVRSPVAALVVAPGRQLQVELEAVAGSDRVDGSLRSGEREADPLVAGDRARKVVDQELRGVGGDPGGGRSHHPSRCMRAWRARSASLGVSIAVSAVRISPAR
jgi:hypothetical protein